MSKHLYKRHFPKSIILVLLALFTLTTCTNRKANFPNKTRLSFYLDSISYCYEDTIAKDQMSSFLYFALTIKNLDKKYQAHIQIEKFRDFHPEKDSILLINGDHSIKLYTSFRANHFNINPKSEYELILSPDPEEFQMLFKNSTKQNLKVRENQLLNTDILLYHQVDENSNQVIIKAIKPGHFKFVPISCLDKWF